ncbi:TetR family transcriptional regulator [Nonomuraea jiangxiensis]|uniref:DNA-binding transcriptional regulator, AcrR family n=1 Tax=Nonomuraea jiangxiensis TaxID=633440 RepID=A0A1G9VZR9_9ACTN|nr:TetR family transcriptional regulator [Nonomuraea jiangxiensis]SDM77613.1 DNA-binding transcriptional regulator, AcrR family [Nonomuraea jiangxiensis]
MSGLRERKKQATREALMSAALRLALERGLDNVRNEDIAAEAGVSPRTFGNYFSSKYEALAARHTDRAALQVAVLRARPPGEPLWQALTEATAQAWESHTGPEATAPDPERLAATRLLVDEPSLQAEAMKLALASQQELVAAVAERTGTDPGRDLYPHLVAGTVTAAVQTTVGRWLYADPPVPFIPLLREALRQVAAGLPDPSTRGDT